MRSALLVLTGLATGCAAPPLPVATTELRTVRGDGPARRVTLGPNDVLQVLLPGRPEFGSDTGFRVSPAGAVHLPIAGEVPVAGKSVAEARAAIEEAIAAYVREPAVGLSVVEYGAHRVYVLGEVARPGAVPLDRDMTALGVLALAQGLKEGARRDRVALLRRHGSEEVEVYFFDAETPGPDGLAQVMPDDVIFVPRSGAGVFRDEALPILQGIGFTTGQIAAVAVAADEL